jgi:hypothetical protein
MSVGAFLKVFSDMETFEDFNSSNNGGSFLFELDNEGSMGSNQLLP